MYEGERWASLGVLEQQHPSGESLVCEDKETPSVCHALLESPTFFALLLHSDEDLAEAAREGGCPACGGTLHQADYPRNPHGCPEPWREAFATRRSFCCAQCRRRLTPRSVRFLGRRVYLGVIVVLTCVRHSGHHPKAAALAATLAVPIRTLRRWQTW